MNEQQSFWQLYNKAVKKLDAKQLGEAIKIIQKLIDVTKHWQLLDDLQNVNSAYSLLLEYMIKGVDDPERQRQYTKFISNCYDIVEKAACLERNREQNPPMTRDMGAIVPMCRKFNAMDFGTVATNRRNYEFCSCFRQ